MQSVTKNMQFCIFS